jgi:hypothetical protein
MGVQTSVVSGLVARAVPASRRASAFGEVQAVLGVAGLASGLAMGALLGSSASAVVGLAVTLEAAALVVFLVMRRASLGRRPEVTRSA